MEVKSSRFVPSLRVKLVLSYLVVALGAILLLVVVVSLAVQNYFYKAQQDLLKASAENAAQLIGQIYHNGGGSWGSLGGPLPLSVPAVAVDTHLQVRSFPPPAFDISAFTQPLRQAVQ